MSGEQNCFPKRERTPKRRSSILKRQDTCMITEEGDEGCRTPRRVSFAKNTLIKEFFAIPWSNHDDSSLHSSKNSHSSLSSSEDAHNFTLSDSCLKNGLQEQNSTSVKTGQPVFLLGSETENHYREASSTKQNKTIHFQDMDGSVGDMNLTSNITELSVSVCSIEDADLGLSKVLPYSLKEQHESKGPKQQTISEQHFVSSTSHILHEHVTMQMTHNVNSTSLEGTSNNVIYTRQLSEEFTEDMELTADLMESSRAALIDIPVNASIVPRHSAVKLSVGSVPAMKPFVAAPAEDQENKPILILHHAHSTNHNTSLSPPLVMKTSEMELTMNIDRASSSVAFTDSSTLRTNSGISYYSANQDVNKGDIISDSVEKKLFQESLEHDNDNFVSGNKRTRLTDQLTSQLLSPVVEMSGLNCSSWSGSQVSSSFNRTSAVSSSNKHRSTNSLQSFQQDKASTKTIYFGSVSTEDIESDAGDIEITNNITCDIQERPLLCGSLKQSVFADQCTETNIPEQEKKNVPDVGPSTKTVYFDSSSALKTSGILENAGDMELTKSCDDSYVNTESAQYESLLQGHLSEPKSSQSSSNSQPQTNTVYFDTGASIKSGDMEFTESVPILNEDIDDPEIKFNFSKNSVPIQEEFLPSTSEESVGNFNLNVNSYKKTIVIDKGNKSNQNWSGSTNVTLCKSFEPAEKQSSGAASESSLHHKQNSSVRFDQIDYEMSSTDKIFKKDSSIKKIDSVKSNLIKDMGSLLTLSRRSSILLNKNVFNARRNLDGLLLNSQDKSRRKSSTPSSDSMQDGQDEVDGMISTSACDNKINSSGIISVFNGTNTPVSSSLKERNSASAQSIFSEKKQPHSISGLKENISIVSSSRDKNFPTSANKNKDSFTLSQTLAGKSHLLGAGLDKNGIFSPGLVPEYAMSSPGKESLDEADLTDEHDMLDFTEDLNVHNLLGKCAVDEEAPEDFLQDLECVMSKAGPLTPKSQEDCFTLQDFFCSIGFDNITLLAEEEIVPPKDVGINSIKEKLLVKIAEVPKIETLQVFVNEMDCCIEKLKEENADKLDQIRRYQNKVRSLWATGKESTKMIALEMCKACRILSRSKWWQREADHLIEFSTQREATFESFKSDIEYFKKETDQCSELINEIDECLHELSVIQEIKKDLEQREEKLSGKNREIYHIKEESEKIDIRTQSAKDRGKEFVHSMETIGLTQEQIKEKLWWLESLTEWTLLEQSNERMMFGFLFNTLVLQVHLNRDSREGKSITDITLTGRLSGASKPWAKLSHQLAASNIDCNVLKSKYNSWDQLSKLLLDVSTIAFNSRQLTTELRRVHFIHRISICGLTLEVYILESKKRLKVLLQTQFKSPHNYPNSKLIWTVTTLFGNVEPEAIREITSQVPPGHQYLTRILSAVEASLSQSKRSNLGNKYEDSIG